MAETSGQPADESVQRVPAPEATPVRKIGKLGLECELKLTKQRDAYKKGSGKTYAPYLSKIYQYITQNDVAHIPLHGLQLSTANAERFSAKIMGVEDKNIITLPKHTKEQDAVLYAHCRKTLKEKDVGEAPFHMLLSSKDFATVLMDMENPETGKTEKMLVPFFRKASYNFDLEEVKKED